MKVMLSGMVNNVANKCGDIVASHNRYGLYFRERIDTPKNNSPYWIAIRDEAESVSASWSLISESERSSWNTEAKRFKRSDSIGLPYYQSGMNYFVGTNINRFLCGESMLTTPPVPSFVPMLNSLTLTAAASPESKILSFSPGLDHLYKLKLWITNGLSAGLTRAYHQYRLLAMLDDSFISGSDIQSLYSARFDPDKSTGNKLFLKAILVNRNTGLVGQPLYSQSFII